MDSLITVIHIITALILITLVLLQDSKSDGLGAGLGGGGSNSVFGATGATTLAQKLTRGAAVVFALTSIGLTSIAKKSGSVVDKMATPPPAATDTATGLSDAAPSEAPTTPATEPTTTTISK